MKKIILSIICLVAVTLIKAQAPIFQWANSMKGSADDVGNSVTVDAAGNVYTTGFFQGTVDFDPGANVFNLISAGAEDIFVSKLDASGNFVWAKNLGGTSSDNGSSIAVDANGNVYTTGWFGGIADFDPGSGVTNLVSLGFKDIFVSKLDVSGNFVWAKSIGGTGNEIGSSIVLDATGNVITTGYFEGTVDFDPNAGVSNLTSVANFDIFISKLSTAGNFVWAKSIGDVSFETGNSVTVDATGNVYTTGYFDGTVDFDPGAGVSNLTSSGADVFVSKLDATGNYVWAVNLGGTGDEYGNSIAVDGTGNVYTTGSFQGTCDFEPGSGITVLNSSGSDDIFVSKLDAAGTYVWAAKLGGTLDGYGTSIQVDGSGNVYTSGYYTGTVDFDPDFAGTVNLTSIAMEDLYISKLNSAGNYVWAVSMGGSQADAAQSVKVDGSGNIYSTGYFNGTVDFDPGAGTVNLSSGGLADIFVHKMSNCVPPAAPTNTTPVANQMVCVNNSATLSATGTGTISWFSSPTSTTAIGTGTTLVTQTLSVGTYTFYAEALTCTNSATRTAITVTVSVCTGLNSLSAGSGSQPNIYPNPNNGLFTIESQTGSQIRISTVFGQDVLHETLKEDSKEIDIRSLAGGIYFITISGTDFQYSMKIIKN